MKILHVCSILLAFLNFLAIVSSSNFSTIYVSFLSESMESYPCENTTPSWLVRCDDSPFQRFELSWDFNYFGVNRKYIFLSPNGAIHFQESQPCSCSCFQSFACNFNSSYYDVIAGFLTDLDPFRGGIDSNITSSCSNDRCIFSFRDIPYYVHPSVINSFDIAIYLDGRITIQYRNISILTFPQVISGLRSPQISYHTVLSSSQVALGLSEWFTSVPGVYPQKSWVVSNSSVSFCPIGSLWCMMPSTILPSFHGSIVLAPVSLSCSSLVSISMQITSSFSGYSSAIRDCIFVNGSFDCNITDIAPQILGDYEVLLYWSTSTSNYSLLPVDSLYLVVNNISIENCSVNSQFIGCSACDFCRQNFSCANLPCVNSTDYGLYSYRDCSGSCSLDSVRSSNSPSICCSIDQTDCDGSCDGKAVTAIDASGALTCCLSGVVDCLGVCDGKAEYDGCGVCDGNNYDGSGCYNGFIVDTGYSDGNLYPVVNISSTSSVINRISILNQNTSKLYVTMSLVDSKASLGPQITFSSVSFTVLPNSTFNSSVVVSFLELLEGSQSYFQSKVIKVTLCGNANFSGPLYSRKVIVYASVIGCSNVSDQQSCSRLPNCLYCISYSSYRVLSVSSNFSMPSTMNLSRTLFVNIIPSDKLTNHVYDSIEGVCRDGSNADVVCLPNGQLSSLGLFGVSSVFSLAIFMSFVISFF